MAMTYLSNNPVVLMLLPDKIYIQEIKLVNNQGGPSKAKIQDMVATRHQATITSDSGSSVANGSDAAEQTAASTLVMPASETNRANNDEDDVLEVSEDELKKEQLLRMGLFFCLFISFFGKNLFAFFFNTFFTTHKSKDNQKDIKLKIVFDH